MLALSISLWMDYMVLVMVVLAFRATDVPSPVATALAMPLANSCRIAGKISSLFFWETKYCNYDLPKTLKRNFFKIERLK